VRNSEVEFCPNDDFRENLRELLTQLIVFVTIRAEILGDPDALRKCIAINRKNATKLCYG
jgi:hypothetical protein